MAESSGGDSAYVNTDRSHSAGRNSTATTAPESPGSTRPTSPTRPTQTTAATNATEADAAAANKRGGLKRSLRYVAMDVGPLRKVDFRRLWLGNTIGFVGYQLTAVAVPVEIYRLTGSSLWVGVLSGVALVPLIVCGLWGGAIADAFDRRLVLLASSGLLWLATLGLLAQALLNARSVPLILALVALQSAAFAINAPTRGAIVPRLLPESEVAAANTLFSTANNLGTVLGPMLAGLILVRWSYPVAYAVDAVLFTFALYAAFRMPKLPPAVVSPGRASRPGLRAVGEGLAFIATRPILLLSFLVDIIAMVLAMPRALFPEVATERFGGPAAMGALVSAIAVGAILGGLFSGWIGRVRRQGLALIAAVIAWGVAVAVAGWVSHLWLAVVLLAVAGAADLVSSVYRMTILQTYAPDELRGRMQGVFTVVVAGGPRLGDLRAGAVAVGVGATASWVGGGIACVVLVVLVGVLFPSLRRYVGRASG